MTRYALSLLLAVALPAAADSDISDAETSFTGARMLAGEIDATFGSVEPGTYSDADMDRYAFFSGNTLYMGVEDPYDNTVDAIVEFFWFESSMDRGSDFYLAVIKARTTPNVEDWELVTDDDPVVSVTAETDTSYGNGAFRWDWSVPFESYGIDSFGEATLKTEYGIGLNAEGSALAGETVDEDGDKVEGTIQVKGYVDNEFKVQSQFQISLYSWEMLVHGTPSSMEWELTLNTSLQNDQSAYHEFFLVMQADEDEPFVMDWLELGGVVQDNWWWWDESYMDVAVTDLVLSRPDIDDLIDDEDEGEDEGDDEGDEGEGHEDDGDDDLGGDDPLDDGDDLTVEGAGRDLDLGNDAAACNMSAATGAPTGALVSGLMLAYFLARRRP